MNPLFLAIGCLILGFLATRLLKHFAEAVPVVLIGLPVIYAGLGIIAAFSLAQTFGLAVGAAAAISIASGIGGFFWGGLLGKSYFNSSMKN